jgi:uncharacterized protein (DUF433 family)
MLPDRITRQPEWMGGEPCIRGLRVTVGTLVGLVALGHANSEILAAYPHLEEEDIRQAVAYAGESGKRLAAMGGTQPRLVRAPRRRS